MDRIKVNIGDKSYNCYLAKTEEEKNKGLLDFDNLPNDEGMLFVWDDEEDRSMHMNGMKFPIDLIAINDDDEVIIVYHALPTENGGIVTFPNTKYILEVNENSGITEGDEFEIDDSDDLNKYVMKVLAPDGSTQMNLLGGERIFSRICTKQLIKWAKRAYEVKDNTQKYDKICRRLGKRIFRELKAQNERDPEYVQTPSEKS